MADIVTVRLESLYRSTATAVPDWSTEDWPIQMILANKGEKHRVLVPFATPITRSFTNYLTIEHVALFNLHATASVTIIWTTTVAVVCSQILKPGRLMVIPDANPASPLTLQGIGVFVPLLYVVAGT